MKNKKEKNIYYFEMTDTFGGDLNYCWLHRFVVESVSIRGAVSKISKEVGFNFKNTGLHFKAKKACVALYELDIGQEVTQDWINKAKKL